MTQYGKITSFYSRRSVGEEDRDGGKSNSVVNQTGFVKDIFTENFIGFTLCQNEETLNNSNVFFTNRTSIELMGVLFISISQK
mgnify:CR=1 FL=1